MKKYRVNVRFAALLGLAAESTGLLVSQSVQAAQRKVMMENFTATW